MWRGVRWDEARRCEMGIWGGVGSGWGGAGLGRDGGEVSWDRTTARDGMQGVMALHIWYTPRSSSPSQHSTSYASVMRYGAAAHYIH